LIGRRESYGGTGVYPKTGGEYDLVSIAWQLRWGGDALCEDGKTKKVPFVGNVLISTSPRITIGS
jgi:hypothetical protein